MRQRVDDRFLDDLLQRQAIVVNAVNKRGRAVSNPGKPGGGFRSPLLRRVGCVVSGKTINDIQVVLQRVDVFLRGKRRPYFHPPYGLDGARQGAGAVKNR